MRKVGGAHDGVTERGLFYLSGGWGLGSGEKREDPLEV